MNELTVIEVKELEQYEAVIDRGLKTFVEVCSSGVVFTMPNSVAAALTAARTSLLCANIQNTSNGRCQTRRALYAPGGYG